MILLRGRNPFKEFPWGTKDVRLVFLVRALTGQLNYVFYNLALPLLPLGLLTIIHKTTPFWTGIMGYFIMREAILPIEIFGMFICFAAFIAITLNDRNELVEVEVFVSPDEIVGFGGHVLGAIFIFFCSWLVAGAFVANRLLKGIDVWAVMFFHGIFGLLMGICYTIMDESVDDGDVFIFFKYSPYQYFVLFLSCIADVICIYSGFVAAQSGTLGFVGLVSYTAIFYAFLTDLFIFHEELQIIDMLAATAIMVTTMGVSIYKIKSERKTTK